MFRPTTSTSSLTRSFDRRTMLMASLALYAAACVFPALKLHVGYTLGGDHGLVWHDQGYESIRGYELLWSGWFGPLVGNFAVFANPALWLAWLLSALRFHLGAAVSSGAALVISTQTFRLYAQPYLFDEGGARKGYLHTVEIGFICWVASMVLVLLWSLRAREAESPARPPAELGLRSR